MTEALDTRLRNILAAFPRRPLRILRTGEQNELGWAAFGLVIVTLVCAAAVWMAPEILKDMEIRKDPVAVPQAYVDNGKCSTKILLVSCGAKIVYSVDDKLYATSVSFMFVSDFLPGGGVTVVRSASRPELATLDIGLEHIWNRIGTFAGILGLFMAMGIALIVVPVQTMRFNRMARTTDDLTPLAIRVRKITVDQQGKTVACSYDSAGRRRRFSAQLGTQEDPFFLGGASALAVLPANCRALVLVDETLSRLDLTDKERQALYAARGAWPRMIAVN